MRQQIDAQIICDSEYNNSRLTTYLLTVPKYLVYDITRHRAFSYSIGSSRAIPVKKMLANSNFMPTFWGKNKSGMQAEEGLSGVRKGLAKAVWKLGQTSAKLTAWALNKLGVHKQTCNRVHEYGSWVKIVMTGTEWEGFFALRAEYNAEPELGYLATIMLDLYLRMGPSPLTVGEWHIPFLDLDLTPKGMSLAQKLVRSTACCARASYHNFYGKNCETDDLRLYGDLKTGMHWSPFEHQAQAGLLCGPEDAKYRSNFSNCWKQHRKIVEEYQPIDLNKRLADMRDLCRSRGFIL